MNTRRIGWLGTSAGRVVMASLGLSLSAGCAGSAPAPADSSPQPVAHKPSPAPAKAAASDAKSPAPTAIPNRALLSLLHRAPLAANPTRSSAKTAAASLPENGKGDVRENYRAIAPATVIIRTPNGMGTGVIIGPSGWILTNNHVIDGGEKEDFKIKVTVEMGTLDKSGGMERSGKLLTAYVHKADPVRDLAVIKLDGNHKDLPSVRLAKTDPAPGEPVASLGHAGSGLVWAIKDGEVAAVGKLSTHLSQLVALECSPTENESGCKEKHQMFEGLKKMLDHDKPLMVVQSTCPNWPGDSGGPLVNRASELVGLNSFGYGSSENRSTFHVHVSEIRAFLEEIPKAAADILPDPWFDGGSEGTIEDADLDGRFDVLRTEGRDGLARFYDLDQNSYGSGKRPEIGEVFAKRAFDAEVVYLASGADTYVWYDTDNDNYFDVMLFDEGSTGRVSRGYRIGADKRMARDKSIATGGPLVQPDKIKDDGLRQTLGRLGSVTLGQGLVDLRGPLEQGLPDPILGGGREVEVADLDGDGQNDTLETSAVYSHGYVFDIDQSSLAEVVKGDQGRSLLEKKGVDAEVSVIGQGPSTWVWYDRNDDGKFDFVTHASRSLAGVALEAFRVGEDGRKEPAPEAVGRKLLRPRLLESSSHAMRLGRMSLRALASTMTAIADDGIDSFPDPARHGGLYYSFGDTTGWSKTFGSKVGWDKAVIVTAGLTSNSLIVDVNRDSPAPGKQRPEEVLDGGKYKPDFAFLHRDGLEWTYYDTDGDSKYDLVLFTTSPSSGVVERGFRIDKNGAVQLDPALAGGRMVRWSVFAKKPTATQFKKLAAELFQPRAIEE
ncbi:S1 family peptidase [Polyangium aurulentum]|uniref:S1 family peptidase n=1 Tax=Polyangium aurulentum TaxID=2567896 RepID=UPI001469FA3E|nr:serine protease [Polyangium aurulentum]UQA60719.1 serine protease [Polyangium aurulentum]